MEELKKQLIKRAEEAYGKIYPCINKSSLDECFTMTKEDGLILWFNTKDNSTHLISSDKINIYDVFTLKNVCQSSEKMAPSN